MAPERPPSLAIFDARFDNDTLKGSVEYVEQAERKQLRVRWSVDSKPEGFIEVGGGVAYVYDEKGVEQVPSSPDASPTLQDGDHYAWEEGLEEKQPWLMYILILPEGHTLRNPNPMPQGIKIFDNQRDEQGPRLALFWLLKPGDFWRTKLECEIIDRERDLESERKWINRNYVRGADRVPRNRVVAVDAPHSWQEAVLQWLWTTPRWLQLLILLIALLLIIVYAIWTSLPEDTRGQLIDLLFSS